MAQTPPLSLRPDLIQSDDWSADDDALVFQAAQAGVPSAVLEARRRGLIQ